jgi:thiamine-monophosphate kinase
MSARPIREQTLIRALRSLLAAGDGVRVGIGDDCAVLAPDDGALLLATTDLLIEDVHFRRAYAEPADIGWKAMAVNLSDIASMGGRPRWALVALACPPGTELDEVEAFYQGARAVAADHGVAIVGGDTSASPCGWVVNVTLLGDATDRPLLRSTAQVGDIVAVTGALGRSAAGLAVLTNDATPADIDAGTASDATAAHLRPRPRVKEGRWLAAAGGVNAMIDISDGLVTDLGHITEESAVGARIDVHRIPITEGTRRLGHALGHDPVAWATGGGEDYDLLVTCGTTSFDRLSGGLERDTGASLHAIGEIVPAAAGVRYVDARGDPVTLAPGFEHFAVDR